jgi:hypothetical protein
MDSNAMTQQPQMPEIPGYPYQTAPGYVPSVEPVLEAPAAPAQDVTYANPGYEVAHNYVVPTVTESYYATADTYTQPGYAQPVYTEPVYAEPVYAQPVYAEPVYAQPVYEAPVYQAPPAAPAGLSRTEQRKREEAARKSMKKSNSLFKAWWLYPLVAAIAVCAYLGWKSAQVPVSNAPSTPVVVNNQP